jgi:intron-binding protein aquarius
MCAGAIMHARLQRVVLIGDHHQLPPVVKHAAFARHAHLDQSLFARLVRLGVPHVLLDRQGRARPDIAALYAWRYTGGLGNLPAAVGESDPRYARPNPGFLYTHQFVDVGDFQGKVGTNSGRVHVFVRLCPPCSCA